MLSYGLMNVKLLYLKNISNGSAVADCISSRNLNPILLTSRSG